MDSEKRGDAVAAAATGEPPALLTSTSRRPKRSVVAATTVVDIRDLAHVGGDEHRLFAAAAGKRFRPRCARK